MLNEVTTDHEYICSMSPMCKAVISLHEKHRQGTHDNFRRMVESVVKDIAGNEEIANSLKAIVPEMRWLRQVDIRRSPDDPDVIFKCFVFWDKSLWHVLVEGGLEDYWEKQGRQVPVPSSVEAN